MTGDTYDYEKGEYATVELDWNDADRTLTIGERQGSFPEMLPERTYRVVLATPDTAFGIDETTQDVREVEYSGSEIVVHFKNNTPGSDAVSG